MTALAVDRRVMPNGHLFMSPLGLYPFQVDAVVEAWADENKIGVIDVGLGKTIIFLALACQLFEAGEIDQVILCCRAAKIKPSEFPKDFEEFTTLNVVKYVGTGRQKRLEKAQMAGKADVIMTTYETAKADLMKRDLSKSRSKNKRRGIRTDGPLMAALDIRNRRTLWVFDEIIKLANRSSETWQSFDYALREARKVTPQRVLGLHANAMSVDYSQGLNLGLIVAPWKMPSITEFENRCTHGKDDYGRYSFNKEADTWFAPMFQSLIYRKRATDPDVVTQYPKLFEKLVPIELEPAHRALYDAVGGLYGNELTDEQEDLLRSALRLTLGHPRAHLHSQSELSRAIVETLGEEGLSQIPSTKTKWLIENLRELTEGGKQVLVFTWYAETVMPEVARDLEAAGIKFAQYKSSQSTTANEEAKAQFKDGIVPVLFSSDAGAEGLNLPEADVIIEYESAHTFDRRSQRFGRNQRITSMKHFVYGQTLVCTKTLDIGQIRKVLKRNQMQDSLLGDTNAAGWVTAQNRKQQLMNGVIA